MQRRGRKVAASDLGAGAGEFADEAAAAAGHFQNAQTGDGAEVFPDQAIPGAGGVFV